MPDTSKMPPEEYAAYTAKLATRTKTASLADSPALCGRCGKLHTETDGNCPNVKPRCETCGWPLYADTKDGCTSGNCSQRPLPQRETKPASEFKPGQTVWRKSDGEKFTVSRLSDHDFLVVICENRSIRAENYEDFSATDPRQPGPSAEVENPQKCPFCGNKTKSHENDGNWTCYCPSDGWLMCLRGPEKPTRLEAIQAWNSIRVVADPAAPDESVPPETDDREWAAKILEGNHLMGLVYHMLPEHIATVREMRKHLAESIRRSFGYRGVLEDGKAGRR